MFGTFNVDYFCMSAETRSLFVPAFTCQWFERIFGNIETSPQGRRSKNSCLAGAKRINIIAILRKNLCERDYNIDQGFPPPNRAPPFSPSPPPRGRGALGSRPAGIKQTGLFVWGAMLWWKGACAFETSKHQSPSVNSPYT